MPSTALARRVPNLARKSSDLSRGGPRISSGRTRTNPPTNGTFYAGGRTPPLLEEMVDTGSSWDDVLGLGSTTAGLGLDDGLRAAGEYSSRRAGLAASSRMSPGAAGIVGRGGLAKWGGRALKGVGVLAALAALKQVYDGFQGEFGDEDEMVRRVGDAVETRERATAENALSYEQGIAQLLSRGERGRASVGMDSEIQRVRQEQELQAMLVDRGQELDAISEKYQPSLAERMARMGVL